MESKSRATAAGLFVIVMTALLVSVLFWFSSAKKVDQMEYDIFTSGSVNGLLPQANVELHGISVGTVKSIEFVRAQPGLIQVRLLIDKTAPITKATYAVMDSRGVTGSTFVNLLNDTEAGEEKRTQLISQMVTDEIPQIPLKLTTFQTFTENAQDLVKQVETAMGNLNNWLSEENEKKLFTAVVNAGEAAKQIAQLGHTLDAKSDEVMSNVAKTLDQLSVLTANANKLIKQFNAPDGTAQQLNEGVQALVKMADHINYITLPQIDHAMHTIDSTVGSVNRFVNNLEGQPQALLLGPGDVPAGPGEAGFKEPSMPQGNKK